MLNMLKSPTFPLLNGIIASKNTHGVAMPSLKSLGWNSPLKKFSIMLNVNSVISKDTCKHTTSKYSSSHPCL